MNEPSLLQIIALGAIFLVLCILIAKSARRWAKPHTPEDVRAAQLREASIQALQWEVQAEHATAMATMFNQRAQRLSILPRAQS